MKTNDAIIINNFSKFIRLKEAMNNSSVCINKVDFEAVRQFLNVEIMNEQNRFKKHRMFNDLKDIGQDKSI